MLSYENYLAAARLISDNFAQLQNSQPFVAGNRVDINQRIGMTCTVEGNPRPVRNLNYTCYILLVFIYI